MVDRLRWLAAALASKRTEIVVRRSVKGAVGGPNSWQVRRKAGFKPHPKGIPGFSQMSASARPTEIGLLVFPNVQQLDLTGPYEVLASWPKARVRLVAKTLDPVVSSTRAGR